MSDMNIAMEVNMGHKDRLAAEVVAAFQEVGARAVVRGDGTVDVAVNDGQQSAHVLPIRAGHGRPQEVRDALYRLERERESGVSLVVADHFTSGALTFLRDSHTNYLDDRVFVFQASHPLVLIRTNRAASRTKPPRAATNLGGMSGRAVQVLLQQHDSWWRVTQLADAAGVSAGTAQNVLRRLDDLGFVETQGSGPDKRRRVAAPADLLDEWALAAGKERRVLTTTFVSAQGPVGVAREVSERLRLANIAHAVTGACAALLIAPYATSARKCEVWVDPAASAPLVLRALANDEVAQGGNVVVLKSRTTGPLLDAMTVEGVDVASPFRVYADLLADPQRGEEQAKFLREGRIGF